MKPKPRPRSPRVPKTIDQQVLELEYHAHEVRRCLGTLRHSVDNIRTLATELRVLLCLSSGTDGLLWRVLARLNISDSVAIHVPMKINESHPFSSRMAFFCAPLVRANIWTSPPPKANISFRQVIKEHVFAFAGGIRFTHEELIRKVAEQTGSGHESEDVEVAIVELFDTVIGDVQVPVHAICTYAWLAVELSERAIEHFAKNNEFKRRTLSPHDGEMTLVVGLRIDSLPAELITTVEARADPYELELAATIDPQGFSFRISRPNGLFFEVRTPHLQAADDRNLYLYSFAYSSQLRQFRVSSSHWSGQVEALDLGWIDGTAFAVKANGIKFGDIASFRLAVLLEELLGQEHLRAMHDAPDGTFGMLEDTELAKARGVFP